MTQSLRKIAVKVTPGTRYDEGEADGAISPGMAIELAADGKYDQVAATQAEATKGSAGLKIATEDMKVLAGDTVDDAYADGDQISFLAAQPGDEFLLLVKSGENIAIGDTLIIEGGGSGLFVEAAGSEASYPAEALATTGGALAANELVLCRIV